MANPNLGDVLTYNGTAWVNQPWVQRPFTVGPAASPNISQLSAVNPSAAGTVLTILTGSEPVLGG